MLNVRAAHPLLCAFALASSAANAQEIPDIPYTRFRLQNGLTVVVHEDHKAPIAAVNLWYHVGSKDERPGRTGFAHLFEHLMFQPTQRMPNDFIKTLEALGATDLNGTTENDRTNYFENVPVSALDTVLWLESERMGHLLESIDQKKLDLQRGVVQNEKRQSENEPYGRVDDALWPAIYPKGHPYSWTVIGSMEDLSAASLEDVKDWFRTAYGPSNATLVIAGDVKPDDVKARVERFFGDIPPGPPLSRRSVSLAKRSGEDRQELEDRVPAARVHLVWNTPQRGTQDDQLLRLAAAVLSSGKSSRLYKRVVYDEQTATDVQAAQQTLELGSTFLIASTARPGGDIAAVEKSLREELARFLAKGPTKDELDRARTAILAGFIRHVERIGGFGGKSDVLAAGQVYAGDPAVYKKHLAWVKAATPAQVLDAARRWLSDGVHVLTVHPFPELAAGAAGDRAKCPEPGRAPEARFPPIERATLPNGLTVVLAERHAVPTVQVSLFVDAGYASDLGGLPGTAKLAGGMLDEGTSTRSSLAISDDLQRLGAHLDTGSNLDQSFVALSALKANLDPSLKLFADVVLSPSFPASDFERLKKRQLAAIHQESVEPFGLAQRVLPRVMYGADHPYGNPLTGSGTAASVAKLTREDCVRWHRTFFKPNAATLVAVGDIGMAELKPKIEKLFGAWKAGEVSKRAIAEAKTLKQSIYVIDRPGALQSLILMGALAPPRNNPDAIPQEVMNAILGGQFSSRINQNLREDKHWAYGASTLLLPARGPRPFIGFAPVQTDRTKEALAEFIKELRWIRGERPATAEELAAAQASLTLALPGQWETSRAVGRSVAEIIRFGLDDRYFDGYAAKVRAVDLGAVSRAAQLADPGRVVWVVVGDRGKIEAGLKELGLGAPQVLDADGSPVKASTASQ